VLHGDEDDVVIFVQNDIRTSVGERDYIL